MERNRNENYKMLQKIFFGIFACGCEPLHPCVFVGNGTQHIWFTGGAVFGSPSILLALIFLSFICLNPSHACYYR